MRAAESLLRISEYFYRKIPSKAVRAMCFNAFAAAVRNRTVTVVRRNIRYSLDLAECIELSVYLNVFERDTVAFIEKLRLVGATALDIGANVGAHALPLGKLVGPNGRVFAFEPTDDAFRRLQRNIALNPFNVKAFRIALSDENLPQQENVFKGSFRFDEKPPAASSTPVDLVRLDDWCVEQGVRRVDFVKLDVDGFEYRVLRGGRGVLSQFPLIVMEVGSWHFSDPATNPLNLLADAGFWFWDLRTLNMYPSIASIGELVPEGSVNIAAARKSIGSITDLFA
jgi:FkbM family methyltransferase